MLDATPPRIRRSDGCWPGIPSSRRGPARRTRAPWNAGTLTTAGNLVFQGTADGRFVAYNATTGEKLWEARPARRGRGGLDLYVDGKQYVSIAVGWGGVIGQWIR